MTEQTLPTSHGQFDRITFDPGIMGGRACIPGMRVTVAMIVAQGQGVSIEDILADYPYLERQDIEQALAYSAWLASEEVSCAFSSTRTLATRGASGRWRASCPGVEGNHMVERWKAETFICVRLDGQA